jgi:DEAD/DEAH box helicase domain-containing protein
VTRLDLALRIAELEEHDADEYTQPRTQTDIEIDAVDRSDRVGGAIAHLGWVRVTSRVVAYQRKRASTGSVLEVVELDLPERTLVTRACWYTAAMPLLLHAGVPAPQVLGAVHAAEHALIGMLPLFTICDRWDVGGVSMALHPQTDEPTIFVYDGYPGGAGIAELAYDARASHADATHELVSRCGCDDGCPSCVQSPKCGNWNEYLDKRAAIALLSIMADRRA